MKAMTYFEKRKQQGYLQEHVSNFKDTLDFMFLGGVKDTLETSSRFLNYLEEIGSGISISKYSLIDMLTESPSITTGSSLITVCRENIKFNAACPHHLLPYFGTVSIKMKTFKFCGISKLDRLVNVVSKKLLTQEEMTEYIGEILRESFLFASYIQVIIKATHTCVSCRGVESDGVYTTVYEKVFKDGGRK